MVGRRYFWWTSVITKTFLHSQMGRSASGKAGRGILLVKMNAYILVFWIIYFRYMEMLTDLFST